MNEKRGFVLGPEARVAALRRHDGYAVVVVLDEGPFSHDEACAKVRELSRHQTKGYSTKAEAAGRLGLSQKGVDYLRSQGRLEWTTGHNGRVLISDSSISEYQKQRHVE
jgi:hypothetical protein